MHHSNVYGIKGVSIKCVRSNGRGEYLSNEFSEYLKEHGIHKKYSCSYSPQHNGVAKMDNMHIIEITRAMLNEIAKLLLGGIYSNYILYHELNTHDNNSWHDT
jgi:hypothetical protein